MWSEGTTGYNHPFKAKRNRGWETAASWWEVNDDSWQLVDGGWWGVTAGGHETDHCLTVSGLWLT